jgi:hypothetical protein
MLQVDGRPTWRVVVGGSDRYVQAMTAGWHVDVRRCCAVRGVLRDTAGVDVDSGGRRERFDHVVFACHSDQALALLRELGMPFRGEDKPIVVNM